MLPAGRGELYAAFNELKARLEKEGLFDPSRKRALPGFPSRLGVVTSPTGAAVRDVIRVARKIYAGVEIIVSPVRVQGEGAAEEIAAAIADFNARGGVDVIILAQGWRLDRGPVGLQRGSRGQGDKRVADPGGLGGRPRDRFHHRGFRGRPQGGHAFGGAGDGACGLRRRQDQDWSLWCGGRCGVAGTDREAQDFLAGLATRYGLRRIGDRIVTAAARRG